MIVYKHTARNTYALMTDLYHNDSWVYLVEYFGQGEKIITTCQPGTLQLDLMPDSASPKLTINNTGSSTLSAQLRSHAQLVAVRQTNKQALHPTPAQHLELETTAYNDHIALLLSCTVLRQADTSLLGFTRTGASCFQAAATSKSARRPQPQLDEWISKSLKPARLVNRKSIAVAATVLCAVGVGTYALTNKVTINPGGLNPEPSAEMTATSPDLAAATPTDTLEQGVDESVDLSSLQEVTTEESILSSVDSEGAPEQYVLASSEDEMWRIAVENAEFYLMSNDGNPAPWIRTARKMATSFPSNDPRLARTYFLTALLEKEPRVAEQQYNRALSIQTKSLGLYHTETAQTLEALAWVAESSRDALEDAITHQKLALNIYRTIFGEDAEDTKAAKWKLQYFEDRLAGRRPKTDGNHRLLPALAKFGR